MRWQIYFGFFSSGKTHTFFCHWRNEWSSLAFYEMIKFMISMESRSLKDELLHYFDYDVNTPSNSSFNQRRSQILPETFEFLFHEFNDRFSESRFWHGLQLVACDGSELNIYRNPDDPDNYFPNGPDNKEVSQIHLNALYDLCTRRYVDAVIQPGIKNNKCRAMVTMIDRYSWASSRKDWALWPSQSQAQDIGKLSIQNSLTKFSI